MFEKLKSLVEFLKNIAIIVAFIGVALEFLAPSQFRQLTAELDLDRSWYFVGTWDSGSNKFIDPRFTSGASWNPIKLGEDARFPSGTILLPFNGYTRSVISESDMKSNKLIVGRSMPSARGEITYLPKGSDCLYVHDTSVTPVTDSNNYLVWVFASVQEC